MHLLGEIHSQTKQQRFDGEEITESIINKARIIFRTNIDQDIAMEKVAEELNVTLCMVSQGF